MAGDVTHAKCARCNSVQPIIWRGFKALDLHADGTAATFEGMECECRSCKFQIAQLGSLQIDRVA